MKHRAILLLAIALVAPFATAAAQPATKAKPPATKPAADLAGSWMLKVQDAVIFRFDLVRDGDGWRGTWVRPRSFASSGDAFSRLSGESTELASGAGKAIGEWAELTFPDERPGAVPDVFRFRLLGDNRVEMIYAETGLAPFTLMRAEPTTPLGPFEANRVYRRQSVEMLGLPPEPIVDKPAEVAAPPADAAAWSLTPRRTDAAPATGGR